MVRFDILMKNYTGKGVKIALIDNGIRSDFEESQDVNGHAYHASVCAKIIQTIAMDVELADIKMSSSHEVTEVALIDSLYNAIAGKPDIINISIGFNCCSKELRSVIQKAVDSGIIIVAAKNSRNIVTYPANISGVIEVGMIKDEGTTKIAEICDHEFIINESKIPLIAEYKISGTSYACAFCTALVALTIESRPFIRRNHLFDEEYQQYKNSQSVFRLSSERVVKKIPTHTALYCDAILGLDIKQFSKYLTPNIEQCFDSTSNSFFSCSDRPVESFKNQTILSINPHEYPNIKGLWKGMQKSSEHFFIGQYNDMTERTVDTLGEDFFHTLSDTFVNKIFEVETPTVMIGGFGCNSNKFSLLLELVRAFKENDYTHSTITYNPLGVAFDFKTFLYPKAVSFPSIVFSINQAIENLIDIQKPDVLIIDCPGSLSRVENDNSKLSAADYGQLPLAYLNAVQVDTFVLSIPIGVKLQEIRKTIKEIENKGVANIVLVVAPIQFLPNNVPRDFSDFIYADEDKQEKCYNVLKQEFSQYTCLKISHLKESLLFEVTSVM